MNAANFQVGQKVIAQGQGVAIKVVAIQPNGVIVCKNKYGVTGSFVASELRAV